LPHEIRGGLDEVAGGYRLKVFLGEPFSFDPLMVKAFGQLLLCRGELECELRESSELLLVFRKGLGHVVEHPVDFQMVVGAGIVLFCLFHEGLERGS
jgi:hypothetical protein